jgi:hypothetical protein
VIETSLIKYYDQLSQSSESFLVLTVSSKWIYMYKWICKKISRWENYFMPKRVKFGKLLQLFL